MYLFWHAFFAGLLALLIYRLAKPNPAWPFLFAVTFFGVFPDIDHLLSWSPDLLTKLFPRYLTEGLSFSLRTSVYPCYLHLWLWPLILIATAIARKGKPRKYILAAAAGWMLHLALDGVTVLL